MLRAALRWRDAPLLQPEPAWSSEIFVCSANSCTFRGADATAAAIEDLAPLGTKVQRMPCFSLCSAGPNVYVDRRRCTRNRLAVEIVHHVEPSRAGRILSSFGVYHPVRAHRLGLGVDANAATPLPCPRPAHPRLLGVPTPTRRATHRMR